MSAFAGNVLDTVLGVGEEKYEMMRRWPPPPATCSTVCWESVRVRRETRGGWLLHASRVLVSISIGCVVLMSFGLPQRTISSVGWLVSPSKLVFSAYTVGFSLAAIHL